MTKTLSIRVAKKILDNLEPGEKVTEQDGINFLLKFFSTHPNLEEKMKGGFDYFFKVKNTDWAKHYYCFAIMRKDGTHVTISVNFQNTNNSKYIANQALRNSVEHIIYRIKYGINYGVDRCAVTNELLEKGKTHIDHYDLDFKDVVDLFLKKFNLTFDKIASNVVWDMSKPRLNSDDINDDFIEFHNANTHLRVVTSNYNLTRKKS